MKKAAGFIVLLIFMTGLIGCSGKRSSWTCRLQPMMWKVL